MRGACKFGSRAFLLALVPALALGASIAPVVIGETPLSDEELEAGVAVCRRDAPELGVLPCVRRLLVPLYRLDREVERRGLDQSEAGRQQTARVLYQALYRAVEKMITVSPEQRERYQKAHPREFSRPQRLRLFRILVPSEEQAREVLAKLGPDTTLTEFRALCREVSQDDATVERGGDLGFVWPDGTTDVPQLRTDPVLYAAASKEQDGAFVPEPVPEGERFAIVWRRGSLPAVDLPKEETSALIQDRLVEEATRKVLDGIVAKASPHINQALLGKLQRPECKLFED